MALRVAINGFGRIGRNILRGIIEAGRKDIQIVALNDLGPVETNAHLLRFDREHDQIGGGGKRPGRRVCRAGGHLRQDRAAAPHIKPRESAAGPSLGACGPAAQAQTSSSALTLSTKPAPLSWNGVRSSSARLRP